MSLHLKCAILKRVVYLLGLYEWMALPIGTYFIGKAEIGTSLWFFLSSAISYIISYELGYIVSHMIIRQELNRKDKEG